MSDPTARVAAIKAAYEGCFGCGNDNLAGLGLGGFSIEHDRVVASFTPREHHRGFAGMLHGGIVAAALDETMAWTAMLLEGVAVVTATLDLRYRNPAPVDGTFRMVGRVDSRRSSRLQLTGEMYGGDRLLAHASGLFLATGPATEA